MSSGNWDKLVLVTDGATGLGFEIVKKLCQKLSRPVYFTSKNTDEGKAASEELLKLGLRSNFLSVDITNRENTKFIMKIIKYYEGELSILINNAEAKCYKPYQDSITNIADEVLCVNYQGTRDFTQELFYIMKRGSKVLNISSDFGYIENIPSIELRKKLSDPKLTISDLDSLVQQYKDSVSRGTYIEDGWGDDPYIVSKVFVTALTSVQQRYIDSLNRDVTMNCINAGYSVLDTMDNKTMEQKAEMIVAAALDSPDRIKGSLIC